MDILSLVGIEEPDLPVLIQGLYALVQRVGRQHVVMIGKGDKNLPWAASIPALVFSAILRAGRCAPQRILLSDLSSSSSSLERRRRFAASVGKAQFPVGICLFTDRVHQLAEIFLRSFIERHHNGYLRLIFKFLMALFLQFPGARQMAQDPFLIGDLSSGRCFYLGNDLSQKRGASLASPVTYSTVERCVIPFLAYFSNFFRNTTAGWR